MGIRIEVTDLENTERSALIKAAKFMLEFAGYAIDTTVATTPAPAPVAPTQHVWPEDLPADNGQPVQDAEPKASNVFAMPVVTAAAPVNVAPPPPQAPGIEVDAKGMPWDNRIHSGSRAKTADGSWRQKRNLDPNLLAQVEGELRTTMSLPTVAPTTAAVAIAATPTAVVTPESAFIAAVVPPPPAAVAPVQTVVSAVPTPPPFVPNVEPSVAPAVITPPPPTAPAGVVTTASPSSQSGAGVAVVTFPQLMQKITQAFTAKTLDQGTIQAACQQVGLPSLPMLASRPDLVAQVATILGIAL